MLVTQADATRLKVVLSSLRRAKFSEIEGEEILAFAQAFVWASDLQGRIERGLAEQAAAESLAVAKGLQYTAKQSKKKPARIAAGGTP